MSHIIANVENLGKSYRLGTLGAKSLRQELGQWWETLTGKRPPINAGVPAAMRGRTDENGRSWALHDVNFQVEEGQVLGVIGRNGAGKSTMLKILSRITEPTTGSVTLDGRTASLLEVGTGFHPELTGRENVFLNGVMLGLRRKEVAAKFDEIVEFAGVGQFIDTPVKRYSSGMYVRLAFAVAAHLEPEILIVDEVLTVGDLAFQEKCLGKMKDVTGQGRTVFFVSHNMNAVKTLCDRCILMEDGTVTFDGDSAEAVTRYRQMMSQKNLGEGYGVGDERVRRGEGEARFDSITITDDKDRPTHTFETGQTIRCHLEFTVHRPVQNLYSSVSLLNGRDRELVTSAFHCLSVEPVQPGKARVVLEMKDNILRVGEYPTYFWLGDDLLNPYDVVDDIILPINIVTQKRPHELGYNPVYHGGFFDLPLRIINADLSQISRAANPRSQSAPLQLHV